VKIDIIFHNDYWKRIIQSTNNEETNMKGLHETPAANNLSVEINNMQLHVRRVDADTPTNGEFTLHARSIEDMERQSSIGRYVHRGFDLKQGADTVLVAFQHNGTLDTRAPRTDFSHASNENLTKLLVKHGGQVYPSASVYHGIDGLPLNKTHSYKAYSDFVAATYAKQSSVGEKFANWHNSRIYAIKIGRGDGAFEDDRFIVDLSFGAAPADLDLLVWNIRDVATTFQIKNGVITNTANLAVQQ